MATHPAGSGAAIHGLRREVMQRQLQGRVRQACALALTLRLILLSGWARLRWPQGATLKPRPLRHLPVLLLPQAAQWLVEVRSPRVYRVWRARALCLWCRLWAQVAPIGFAWARHASIRCWEAASPVCLSCSRARPHAAPTPRPPASPVCGAKADLSLAAFRLVSDVWAQQTLWFSGCASPNWPTVAGQIDASFAPSARPMRCRVWPTNPATRRPRPGVRRHRTPGRTSQRCPATTH